MDSKLGSFLKKEMLARDMSVRQFAELTAVSHHTMQRYLAGEEPTLAFLAKLAKATGIDLIALVELSYPDVAQGTRPSAESIIFAQRVDRMAPDKRKTLINLVLQNE